MEYLDLIGQSYNNIENDFFRYEKSSDKLLTIQPQSLETFIKCEE